MKPLFSDVFPPGGSASPDPPHVRQQRVVEARRPPLSDLGSRV
jgi:hypothetical protein